MKYQFFFYGHKNISAKHKTTLEITRSSRLSRNGDCIIGVSSNFDPGKIKRQLQYPKLQLKLQANNLEEIITFKPNKSFFDTEELVIRLGHFTSPRTLGTDANKSSKYLSLKFKKLLKDETQKVIATLTPDPNYKTEFRVCTRNAC